MSPQAPTVQDLVHQPGPPEIPEGLLRIPALGPAAEATTVWSPQAPDPAPAPAHEAPDPPGILESLFGDSLSPPPELAPGPAPPPVLAPSPPVGIDPALRFPAINRVLEVLNAYSAVDAMPQEYQAVTRRALKDHLQSYLDIKGFQKHLVAELVYKMLHTAPAGTWESRYEKATEEIEAYLADSTRVPPSPGPFHAAVHMLVFLTSEFTIKYPKSRSQWDRIRRKFDKALESMKPPKPPKE